MKDLIEQKDIDGDDEDDSKIFPQRLMAILSDELNQESICWLPHGKSFIVRNRKLFSETVMPRYFSRKAKYSSFTRKLNRWNFTRVSSGPELGSYHHEFFLRDKPHLAAQMFCKNARTMLAMSAAPAASVPVVIENTSEAISAIPVSPVAPAQAATVDTNIVEQQVLPVVVSKPTIVPTPLDQQSSFATRIHHTEAAPTIGNNSAGMLLKPNDPHAYMAAIMAAKQAGASSAAYGNVNSLQLLERQMQMILQQQEANRMLMAMRIGAGNNHIQQDVGVSTNANSNVAIAQQQQHFMQLRQLMEMRKSQQQSRQPTINRASAA